MIRGELSGVAPAGATAVHGRLPAVDKAVGKPVYGLGVA